MSIKQNLVISSPSSSSSSTQWPLQGPWPTKESGPFDAPFRFTLSLSRNHAKTSVSRIPAVRPALNIDQTATFSARLPIHGPALCNLWHNLRHAIESRYAMLPLRSTITLRWIFLSYLIRDEPRNLISNESALDEFSWWSLP